VRVEPRQAVCGRAPEGGPDDGLVRVEDLDLREELLRLAARLLGGTVAPSLPVGCLVEEPEI
jgi:hypothetical protein